MIKKMTPDALKSEAVRVRINTLEKAHFKDYCKDNDVKEGRLIRKIIRELVNKQPDLVTAEMKIFKDAVKQLAGISRNLNQLTRAVNTGKIPARLTEESYWNDLLSYVKETRRAYDDIIDMTENRWVDD